MLNPLGTLYLAVETSWVSTKALCQHLFARDHVASPASRSSLVYQEAFAIVKSFLKTSGDGTVEDLQAFTSTPAPSPIWVLVLKDRVPTPTLEVAAEHLVDYLGPEGVELAGGKTWWTQRVDPEKGMHCEWIAMKRDWDGADFKKNRKQQQQQRMRKPAEQADPLSRHEEIEDQRCMYYIHGGGYYFGSIETHRYSIWRMARKMAGRAFTVKYRLAPAFPWPCALQDCLAGYLYLIQPPPDAPHKAVNPALIVLGGDSAGGGLVLALLCLLRDLGLPLPAGAVLISPWVDMTESFPSIMTNVDTDVIPPYGFLHKPSPLWPPPAPDELISSQKHLFLRLQKRAPGLLHRIYGQSDTLPDWATTKSAFPANLRGSVEDGKESGSKDLGEKAEPDDVVRLHADGETMVLKDQVHLYCTNRQLTHPAVSPLLTPTLAGLPPLFIVAGDDEVLRDEIIRLAHRAAHPDQYPLREGLLQRHGNERRQKLAQDKQWPPTQVHLQVYDGICHDIALFSFIESAKYCYRAVASFCIRMTPLSSRSETASQSNSDLSNNTSQPDDISTSGNSSTPNKSTTANNASTPNSTSTPSLQVPSVKKPTPRGSFLRKKTASNPSPLLSKKKDQDLANGTVYFPELPESHSPVVDNMVRERVDVHGVIRAMEPAEEMDACAMPTEDIGFLKAAVVKRYLQGRTLWDRKFKNTAKRVRAHQLKKLDQAVDVQESRLRKIAHRIEGKEDAERERQASESALPFGPFGPDKEWPPPSALAARRSVQLSQLVSNVDRGESTSGSRALRFWNAFQNLMWLGEDDTSSHLQAPEETLAGPKAATKQRITEEPEDFTESPTDMHHHKVPPAIPTAETNKPAQQQDST